MNIIEHFAAKAQGHSTLEEGFERAPEKNPWPAGGGVCPHVTIMALGMRPGGMFRITTWLSIQDGIW